MVSNYELITVGEQATPIVVIDGFIPDPLSVVETIAQHHPFTKQDGDFYPGVRSHPPQEYVEWATRFWRGKAASNTPSATFHSQSRAEKFVAHSM